MDKELNCHFYFGDKVQTPIKKIDYSQLQGFRKEIKNKSIIKNHFLWQIGTWKLLFKNYDYYILTGEPNILSNWLILIFGKLFGKKVLVWSHGMKGDPNAKRKWFELYFFKLCYKILLYGNYSRRVMLNKGFADNKLICIYNSLDFENQIDVRRRLQTTKIFRDYFKNEYPIALYIGRLQKNKKLEQLVDAIFNLNQRQIYCNLVFIGGDLGDNNVKLKAKELNIENQIWFYGPCYEEVLIGELIYNADVCVSPGPVGLTALHSLTYGTPVISNNNYIRQMPEHEVIIEGITGSFFNEDNLGDLEAKIEHWIKLDNLKRIKVRENCYNVIEKNWNPRAQIKTLKKVFDL